MQRLNCPHCGFINFSISAYCGRCERPLRASGKVKKFSEPLPPPSVTRLKRRRISSDNFSNALTSEHLKPIIPEPPPPPPPQRIEEITPPPLPIEIQESVVPSSNSLKASEPTTPDIPPLPELPEIMRDAMGKIDAIEAHQALENIDPEVLSAHLAIPVNIANAWRTALALAIDGVVLLTCLIFIVGLQVFWKHNGWPDLSSTLWLDQLTDWLHTQGSVFSFGIASIIVLRCVLTILFYQHGLSVGRWLTRTILLQKPGAVPNLGIILWREFLSWWSLALFTVGYIWMLVDPQHRTWHDILSGTVLVSRKVDFTYLRENQKRNV